MTESHTPAVEALPVVGYLHTMDNTEGIPGNTPWVTFSASKRNPFGKPGIDYSRTFPVTKQALTPHAPAQAQIDALRIENERLSRERDAAFAMSRCECSADEACANLAVLHAELAALKAGKDRGHE